ncbi:MAG: isoprenyl transferase [Acholeplasmatales bacterium]|nr:isoprenyl transferase [Acholeplasmatales bacterium]
MELDMNNIPQHIAIILDGNGRWAKSHGKPRFFGHREGARNIATVCKAASELGVKALTVYCFSTENWKRPEAEVNYLMTMPVKYYKKYKAKILEAGYKIRFAGRRNVIPKPLLAVMEEVERETASNEGFTLTICFDYGSYEELTTATKHIASLVAEGKLTVDEITPSLIESNLYTAGLPKLDLLIRTSGEQRISNFLLWQLGYAELYFTDTYWPDFHKEELIKAIYDFQHRNRRFGGLKEAK